VFAAPVGPRGVERRLEAACDRCVVPETPADLRAVGQWYERFDQTTDDEVTAALRQAR
jgi:predicted phosphoribosyltransferase